MINKYAYLVRKNKVIGGGLKAVDNIDRIIAFENMSIKEYTGTDKDHDYDRVVLVDENEIDKKIVDGIQKATGGTSATIKDIEDRITKKIEGVEADLVDINKNEAANLSLLQAEIEGLNGANNGTLSGKDLVIKEKQDKFTPENFIETADVQFLDLSAISSAAGISADLSGVKAEVSAIKNTQTQETTRLNTVQQDVAKLSTANPDIARLDTEIADVNTDITNLKNKEAADIKVVQGEITAKTATKADASVVNALTGRVTTAENKVTALQTQSNTQASTVTSHTTKIGALETLTGTHTGTLQAHGALLTTHGEGIKDNTDDIKDLKSLVSFMGIYTPPSLPVSGAQVKAKFGEAKLGMFSFVKASTTGDLYQIWTAESITVGGIPQATGDWIHEVGADITINMKPYLEMEMVTDGSRQVGPTNKGEVIYGDSTDPTNNKWVKLTEVLKDAYEAQRIAANKGKLMTIIEDPATPGEYILSFEEPALLGTDLLMEVSGGWSAGYTPQIGDVVVVNEADADGKITKLGATVAKAMFGESEEKTPGSGVWTAKTDSKDKMVVGGDNTTKLVYIDNPDFTTLGTDTRPRIWTFRNSDTKGGWQPLDEAEINGKANFGTTDTDKLMSIKSVDATTGNVELQPIEMKLSEFTTLKDTTVPAVATRVTNLETFQGYFDGATDDGYVFKTDDTNYLTKDVKTMGAELKTEGNFDDADDRLMSKTEIETAIAGSLTTDQKALLAFKAADGTDLSDDDKPVKYTGAKDTSFTQTATRATAAANAKVVTDAGDSVVSLMVGPDDDKKLVSKKYVDDSQSTQDTNITKNTNDIATLNTSITTLTTTVAGKQDTLTLENAVFEFDDSTTKNVSIIVR